MFNRHTAIKGKRENSSHPLSRHAHGLTVEEIQNRGNILINQSTITLASSRHSEIIVPRSEKHFDVPLRPRHYTVPAKMNWSAYLWLVRSFCPFLSPL